MANFALLLIFILLPNISSQVNYSGNENIKITLSFAIALLILLYKTLRLCLANKPGKLPLINNKHEMLILAYLILFLISSIFSVSPLSSILGGFGHTQGGIFFTLSLVFLYFYFRYQSSLKGIKIASFAAVLGIIAAIFGGFLGQKAADYYQGFPIRIYFGQFNPIYFANYIMFGLPLSLGLFLNFKNKLIKTLSLGAFFLILLGVILSLTRTVWIVSIFTLLFFSFLYFKYFAGKLRMKAAVFIAILLIPILALVAFFYPLLKNKIASVVSDPPAYNSYNIRLLEWDSALKMIANRPVLGSGPDTVYHAFRKYRPIEFNENEKEWRWTTTNIRNYYLHLAATTGLPAALAFLAIVILSSFKFLQYLKVTPEKNFLVLGLFCGWFSLSLHFFLYSAPPTSQVFFWSTLGLLIGAIDKKNLRSYKLKINIPPFVLSIFLGYLLVLTVIFVFLTIRDFQSKQIFKTVANKPVLQSLPAVNQAIALNPLDQSLKKFLIYTQLNTVAQAIFRQDLSSKLNMQLDDAQKALNQARNLDPADWELAEKQASLSYLRLRMAKSFKQDRSAEIIQAQKDALFALSLDPTNPEVSDLLTSVYLEADGKFLKEAEESARKTIQLKYTYLHGHHHLGEVLKQQGEFKVAIESYKTALSINPADKLAPIEIEKIIRLQ